MSYKLNGIVIQYLLESGGTNNFTQYTGTNRPTYKLRDANNNIEELTYPLNYKIDNADMNTYANAYSQLYTAVGSTPVSTLIQGTTNSYYKHISAVIVGGGGGAGGGGGDGTAAGPRNTNGGRGGNGAPSQVLVVHNQQLPGSTFSINVGSGGNGGSAGADQASGIIGDGTDGNRGSTGNPSWIIIGSTTFTTTAAIGGGGGGSGNSGGPGGPGSDRTASPDINVSNRTYDSYKVAGSTFRGAGGNNNNKGSGKAGEPGQVKVWFLYKNE